jgi:hypothetical protein
VEKPKTMSTTAPANPPTQPGATRSDSKLELPVGAKQQKVEKATKSTKSAPRVLYGHRPTPSSNLENHSYQK